MPAPPLQLPVIQNWNCHSCAGCCRQHFIEITDNERKRILSQKWKKKDGIEEGREVVVPIDGKFGKKRYRLGHQSDGACIFLNDDGLCRIHAKFGEEAKPLACLVYPYAFHPAGTKSVVSLRFSCPSVVANLGKPVSKQRDEIKKIANWVIPDEARRMPPPLINKRERLEWGDTLRLNKAIDGLMEDERVGFVVKLKRLLLVNQLIDQSTFDSVRGERLSEFMDLICEAATAEIVGAEAGGSSTSTDDSIEKPKPIMMKQFRMMAARYARKDTYLDLEGGWRAKYGLLKSALRFARGKGNIPTLQDALKEVPFASLEGSFGRMTDEMNELMTRYFRVKIQGLHFCGAAYYDVPFVEGLYSLSLTFPVMMWIARWIAVGDGRDSLKLEDLQQAMAIADHHFGYSPSFSQAASRRSVRILASSGAIGQLCDWYSR